jgi:predicted transposase/invertase (TIGR01784 family)
MTVPGLLPFAVLSQTKDPTMVLTQVAQAVEAITNQQQQKNIAAASSILAGLVLKKDVIRKILRSEIMRESVIYQEILEEGEAKGEAKGKAEGKAETTRKLALNLLRIGMNLEQIAEVTELSLEEVQALQSLA